MAIDFLALAIVFIIVFGIGATSRIIVPEIVGGIKKWRATDYRVVLSTKSEPVEVSGPVYAWKLLAPRHPWFVSPFRKTVWLDGWNKTEINPDGWDGFFCCKSTLHFLGYREMVIVKVELAGIVVEHEYGYRAQMARVVSVSRVGTNPLFVDLAAEYFRVPVE